MNPSPSGVITLSAESDNFTDAYFKFTGGGSAFTDETSFTDGIGANSDTASLSIPSNFFAQPLTITVQVVEASDTGTILATDIVSIAAVRIGDTGAVGPVGPTGSTGPTGPTGQGFIIAKTYSSVSSLNADTSPSGINAGEFAIIETGNVQNAENARLYKWSGSSYSFISDLSGGVGFTGPTGPTGPQGPQGIQGTSGSNGVTVTVSETAPSNPVSGDFWFDSSNLKTYVYYADCLLYTSPSPRDRG